MTIKPKRKSNLIPLIRNCTGEKCFDCGEIFITPVGYPKNEDASYDSMPHRDQTDCIRYLQTQLADTRQDIKDIVKMLRSKDRR